MCSAWPGLCLNMVTARLLLTAWPVSVAVAVVCCYSQVGCLAERRFQRLLPVGSSTGGSSGAASAPSCAAPVQRLLQLYKQGWDVLGISAALAIVVCALSTYCGLRPAVVACDE